MGSRSKTVSDCSGPAGEVEEMCQPSNQQLPPSVEKDSGGKSAGFAHVNCAKKFAPLLKLLKLLSIKEIKLCKAIVNIMCMCTIAVRILLPPSLLVWLKITTVSLKSMMKGDDFT